MAINQQQIRTISQQAFLNADETDIARLKGELHSLLCYASILRHVAGQGTAVPQGVSMSLRPDAVKQGLSQQAVIALAPDCCQGMVLVPGVLEE